MKKKIFFICPTQVDFEPIYSVIRDIAKQLGASSTRITDISKEGNPINIVSEEIKSADIVICDMTDGDPNAFYELGYAHALNKPTILVQKRSENSMFVAANFLLLTYDFEVVGYIEKFSERLSEYIRIAFENPDGFNRHPKPETLINSVFISYSHKDTEFLNRLLVHLQPLQDENVIDFWVDTKIKAGDQWRTEIETALKRARVAILLVSADFLASEFITKNELPPLLEKAEIEGTRIIPVIIKPCRFARDKNLSRFQSINAPSSPMIMLSPGEQEKIFDQIAETVERLMVNSYGG